jgi:histidinol-phosphate aminotransferase
MKNPEAWVRPHIKTLAPYTAARDLYGSGQRVFLDANENPYSIATDDIAGALNRYPDPRSSELRNALAERLGVEADRVWIGNGSDEALDLILRVFVDPGSAVVICTPTYAMYEIAARANAVQLREAPLDAGFDLDVPATLAAAAEAKVIFLCSPNNPTGNCLSRDRIEEIAAAFDGLLVIDEAYVEFSRSEPLTELVRSHRNVLLLRTFSKAWGLAGARVGYFVADPLVVDFIDRINLPYPLSAPSQAAARQALARADGIQERIAAILSERERLASRLADLGLEVLPSDANFLLVRVANAREVYRRLAEEYQVVVRDRSSVPRLTDCLRITVGRPDETDRLCSALEEILR